jgi:hypothetical protein
VALGTTRLTRSSSHHPAATPQPPRRLCDTFLLTFAVVVARYHGTGPHGGGLAAFIGDGTTHLTVYDQVPFVGDRPVNPTSQLHQRVGFDRQVARHDAVELELHSSGNRSIAVEMAIKREVILDDDRPLHPAVIAVHFNSTSPCAVVSPTGTAQYGRRCSCRPNLQLTQIGRCHASHSPHYDDALAET